MAFGKNSTIKTILSVKFLNEGSGYRRLQTRDYLFEIK